MAMGDFKINVYDESGSQIFYWVDTIERTTFSINDLLSTTQFVNNGVNAVSETQGGQPIPGTDLLDTYASYDSAKGLYQGILYKTTPSAEIVSSFYLDGTQYVLGGSGGGEWGTITGTLSNQTDLNTALNGKANDNEVVKLTGNQTVAGTKTFSTSPVVPSKSSAAGNNATTIATEAQVYAKQDKLTSQTAYTSKGSATKVPQITTNTLGQVTSITEVTITQPDISGKADKTDVLTKTNTTAFTPTGDYQPATKKYVDDNAGTDYSWVTKTISNNSVEIGIRTIVNQPSGNFTITKPATLKDGEEYVLRTISGATAYTITLGTGFTNPRDVNLTLSANATDQFVFLAVGGELELQPLVATGS